MTPDQLADILRDNPDISVDGQGAFSARPVERRMWDDGTSGLERRFLALWGAMGGPDPVQEYQFHPDRRWRFDFAWPDIRVAVEVEGGIWSGGRHVRGSGYSGDCEKYNAATVLGWRVFRLTSDMLGGNPAHHLGMVLDTIGERNV